MRHDDDAERRVANRPDVLRRVETARLPILYVQVSRLADQARTAADRVTDR